MQVRRDQGPKSFGRRRPTAELAGPEGSRPVAGSSLLAWSVQVSAVIGLVAVAGTTQLARWNRLGDGFVGRTVHTVDGAIPVPADPETTGTVTPVGAVQAARGLRLDPCFAPGSLPAAGPVQP